MTKRINISFASVLFASVACSANASETFDGQTFFFGDLHAHTGVSRDACASDGGLEDPEVLDHWESVSAVDALLDCGPMEDVFDSASIDNGLDFVALTDHHDSDEEDFDYLLGLSLAQDEVLVIPSVELRYETTDVAHYGHKNMYVFQDDIEALEGLDLATLVAGNTVREDHCQEDIYANVAAVDAAFGPSLLWAHHPSASAVQTTDWTCHDEDWEPVVEIYSGWGNALTYDPSFDPVDLSTDRNTDDWESADGAVQEALEMGYRMGFVGGTDRHDTRPGEVCATGNESGPHPYAGGLTMVVLDDETPLTRSAIHDELVGRRTLVTSGPQIPVQVTWTLARGVTRSIGEVIDVPSKGVTTLQVRVPSADEGVVTSVRAVGYDTTSYALTESSTTPGTWSRAIKNATIPSWLYVEVAIDGASYYPEGCDDGGTDDDEFVWSSPTWFE